MITLQGRKNEIKINEEIIALHSEHPNEKFRIVNSNNLTGDLRELLILDLKYKFQLGKYIHSKSQRLYTVLGVVKSLDGEVFVWYRADYVSHQFGDKQDWVRPIKMFNENVRLPGGETKPRYEYRGV